MLQIQVEYGLHNHLKPTFSHIVKIISQNTEMERSRRGEEGREGGGGQEGRRKRDRKREKKM